MVSFGCSFFDGSSWSLVDSECWIIEAENCSAGARATGRRCAGHFEESLLFSRSDLGDVLNVGQA